MVVLLEMVLDVAANRKVALITSQKTCGSVQRRLAQTAAGDSTSVPKKNQPAASVRGHLAGYLHTT